MEKSNVILKCKVRIKDGNGNIIDEKEDKIGLGDLCEIIFNSRNKIQ